MPENLKNKTRRNARAAPGATTKTLFKMNNDHDKTNAPTPPDRKSVV